jgi:uncharacterized membrane protein YedE/YeeE
MWNSIGPRRSEDGRTTMTDLSFTITGADGASYDDSATVADGEQAELVLTVTDPQDGASYTADVLHDGEVMVEGAPVEPTYVLDLGAVADGVHAGEWTATLLSGEQTIATKTLWLDVADETMEAAVATDPESDRRGGRRRDRAPADPDERFASFGAIVAAAAFVLIGAAVAIPLWAKDDDDVPAVWLLTLGLFLIGLFLTLLGAYLVAMEVRSKLRADQQRSVTARGDIDLEDAAKLVDAIGTSRGPIAVLVLGVAVLLATAWIAYGSTREDSPANGASAVASTVAVSAAT